VGITQKHQFGFGVFGKALQAFKVNFPSAVSFNQGVVADNPSLVLTRMGKGVVDRTLDVTCSPAR
jgi:hypothetical protein